MAVFRDKSASVELGRKIQRLINIKVTGETPDPTLTRWLDTLPPKLMKTLAGFGLIDSRRITAAKSLKEHLDDWEQFLLNKGNCAAHVDTLVTRARNIVEGCGFRSLADIAPSRIQQFLADKRKDKRKDNRADEAKDKKGISAQTFNFYLQAIKQFCKWMVREGRASNTPIEHLQPVNVQTDRRHDRRALTVKELKCLLEKTAAAPNKLGMVGVERALLYKLAVQTGLRRGEVTSLTRASFNLDGKPPTVTVQAGYSKNRKQAVLPLRLDLAGELREHLADRLLAAQAFHLPSISNIGKMFKKDIDAAEIAYVDGAGRFADFHSLRHTFISNLAGSGVHPKIAQSLARHSDINLTMSRYTHTSMDQLGEAVQKLPDISTKADDKKEKEAI